MPITQQDIAKRLGISQRLVSYALTGHTGVGAAMRQKIRDEAASLGYRPHRAAQALVSGRTYQIALCFPRFLSSSFYSAIIREFELLARDSRYDLLVITVDPSNKNARNFQFASDGAIFVGPSHNLPSNITAPAVVIQNQVRTANSPMTKGIDRIQLNLEEASFDAVQHLIEQGSKRIAYVAHEAMIADDDWRFHAYNQLMREAGLNSELISLPISNEDSIRQLAHETLKNYFEARGFPEAIFCCNDDIGMGTYRALGDLGQRIPDDTQIVSFDDLGYANYLTPPMSSVHMPVADACQSAWQMLMQRIENESLPPQFESFETRLVARESSRGNSIH